MIHRIAAAGCLHKRPKDIATIKGYVNCTEVVQASLIDFIKERDITHFISMGDWYDRGYGDDVSSALADTSREEYMSKLLNGNFYGVIGNHIRLGLDSNPELTLIQPHPTIKSRKEVLREEPIIKTPSVMVLGKLQISLVHHIYGSEHISEYSIGRLPGIEYHIAFVHDPKFIPNNKLATTGFPPTTSLDSQIGEVLRDVDLCIAGDIHTPMGIFDLNDRTKMFVPGSLTNTNSGIRGRHSSVNIPIIEVDDDPLNFRYKFSFVPFDIHVNLVTFSERQKVEEDSKKKVKSIRGNFLKNLYDDSVSNEVIMTTGIQNLSFGNFLRENGYTDTDKKLIKSVLKKPEAILELLTIQYEDDLLLHENLA